VLARAVVVERRGLGALPHHPLRGLLPQGQVSTAEQVPDAEAAAGEEVFGRGDVLGIAAVGGANQGQVGGRQPEALLAASQEQGEALERLRGRAQVGGGLGITQAGDHAALRGYSGDGPEVPGLGQAAAEDRGDAGEQRGGPEDYRSAARAASTES